MQARVSYSVLLVTDIPFWERRMGNQQRVWSQFRALP
jgi:hypothetical protein